MHRWYFVFRIVRCIALKMTAKIEQHTRLQHMQRHKGHTKQKKKNEKKKNRCAHWNRMKTRGSRSRHLTSILFRKTYLVCSRCSLFATRPVEDTSIGLSEAQKSNWFIDVVCVNVNETKQLLSSCKQKRMRAAICIATKLRVKSSKLLWIYE